MAFHGGIRSGIAAALFAWAVLPLAHAAVVPPGTINFVEGKATVDGKAAAADGSPGSAIGLGHVLETEKGRVEVLLTPGVFLRMAEASAVRLGDAGPDQVRIELLRGEILVEAAAVDRRHPIDVLDHGTDARLTRAGIYEFQASGAGGAHYFRPGRVLDDADALYRWSLGRAAENAWVAEWTSYTLEALGADDARYAEGWYWNPWFSSWAYVPSAGRSRVTPFGFGYYAPDAAHTAPPVFADFR